VVLFSFILAAEKSRVVVGLIPGIVSDPFTFEGKTQRVYIIYKIFFSHEFSEMGRDKPVCRPLPLPLPSPILSFTTGNFSFSAISGRWGFKKTFSPHIGKINPDILD